MTAGLTPRMAECLAAIRKLTVDGVPPSFDELNAELGLSHRSRVHKILTAMQARGVLTWDRRRARSLRIINRPSKDDLAKLPDAELRNVYLDIEDIVEARLRAAEAA